MRNRTFEEFLRSYPTYYSVANNKEMRHIFENIVSREDNMIKMYLAVLSERPALSAISDEIESYYDSLAAPHISLANNNCGIQTKRALGSMVSMVMRPFGLTSCGQRYLPQACRRKYFTCGSVYQKTQPAHLHIVQTLEEIS